MNDEETFALIAGGHTFGKTHGAGDADAHVGPEPEAATWRSRASAGSAPTAAARGATRSPPGSRSPGPTGRRNGATASWRFCSGTSGSSPRAPAGAHQWVAKDAPEDHPGRARPGEEAPPEHADHGPVAPLRPGLRENRAAFLEHPDEFALAFAKAWYKLLHRDMGPVGPHLLGPGSPSPSSGRTRSRRRTMS